MATISSINMKNRSKGYYLDTNEDLMPRIKKVDNDMAGFEQMDHLLFLFAMSAIYKFQCEDFDSSNFIRTREFISAHSHKSLQINKWFKTREMKLLRDDHYQFYQEFMFNLKKDISSYNGDCAKPLVSEMLKELSFFEDKF